MAAWARSDRFDPAALPMADRHYNRRKIGSPQFVPPGRCQVFRKPHVLWVTSWPFAEYVRHAWPGAWINSLFRNESEELASDLILQAVALTRAKWEAPRQGLITFVDPAKVPAVKRRSREIYGYCYLKAGFTHVGYTASGLWAWRLLPSEMPQPDYSLTEATLFDVRDNERPDKKGQQTR